MSVSKPTDGATGDNLDLGLRGLDDSARLLASREAAADLRDGTVTSL